MKKLILICALASSIAFGQGNSGSGHEHGGGNAAIIDGQHYLYDFVEHGIEDVAHIPATQDDEMGITRLLAGIFYTVDAQTVNLLSNKINELYKVSPDFGLLLKRTVEAYRWYIVRPSLFNTHDTGFTPIQDGDVTIVQAAVRDDCVDSNNNTINQCSKKVYINKGIWKNLNPANRVGLILHELIYGVGRTDFGQQDSSNARHLTAYVFSPNPVHTYRNFYMLKKEVSVVTNTQGWLPYDEWQDYNDPITTGKRERELERQDIVASLQNLGRYLFDFKDDRSRQYVCVDRNGRDQWKTLHGQFEFEFNRSDLIVKNVCEIEINQELIFFEINGANGFPPRCSNAIREDIELHSTRIDVKSFSGIFRHISDRVYRLSDDTIGYNDQEERRISKFDSLLYRYKEICNLDH
jgi:hypothetical protein